MSQLRNGATSSAPDRKRRNFGSLLKTYRARSGFSQQALAERAALSSAAIGALEQNKRRAPYAYTVSRLADSLNLSAAEREDFEDAASRARGRTKNASVANGATPFVNLPAVLTPFIDRPEIADLVNLIDERRLVTITGFGGMGKTRSAIEVVRRSSKHPSETVRFLDLSDIHDDSRVSPALASAIGARITPTHDAVTTIVEFFGDQKFLLVFDNCEHLLAPIARLVSTLLQTCPGISILATSREPLALTSENVYRLPPLQNPEKAIGNIDEARSYTAIDLFLDRAYAAGARLDSSPANLALISDVCRQLDGIPLAIELATARVSALGLEVLHARIRDMVGPFGPRDRPARQQTMDATIAWSYDLLTPAERALLRRLCVFAGGFVLDAAENVCGDDQVPEASIADTLSQLVNKSLVSLQEVATTTRYALLESIRTFAWQRLEEFDEKAVFVHRHARWLADIADYLNEKRLGSRWSAYLPECENARSAIERFRDGTGDEALLAARILSGFRLLLMRHYPQDAVASATTLLARVEEREHPMTILRLLWLLLYNDVMHDYEVLRRLSDRAIRLCERLGEDNFLVSTCEFVSTTACWRGWDELADLAIDRADQACARGALTDEHRHASYLGSRAWVRCMTGRLDEARLSLDALFELARKASVPEEYSLGLWVLAEVECASGNYEDASRHCRNALTSEALRFDQQLVLRTKLAGYLLLAGDAGGAEIQARTVLSSPAARYVAETTLALQHLAGAAVAGKQPEIAARLLGFVDGWHRRTDRVRLINEGRAYDLILEQLGVQLSPATIADYAAAGSIASYAKLTDEMLSSSRFVSASANALARNAPKNGALGA